MKNKKLKILMFNRWVGYREGGNETHTKELAIFMAKKGYEVDILTTGGEMLTPIRKYLNKIWCIDTPREYFYQSSLKYFYSITYLFKAVYLFHKILKNTKYDLVITHFSLEAFIMRFVRAIYGVPYVLIQVGDTDLEIIEGKRADNTSQLTHYAARECANYGYYPTVITKGVDRKRFNIHIVGKDIRNKYIKNKNQFLIITVCRIEPRKNLITLIKSAKILEGKYPDIFKFVIVGDGVEKDMLISMAAKYNLTGVYFTGMIPSTSDLLPKHYAAADIFALPTLHEGFGYVFAEAMAFGLPVIGTDTSSVPEVIQNTGIVIPTKSPKILANKIYELYSNKNLRKELSKRSLQKVEEWYWDKLIPRYVEFFHKAIDSYNKRKTLCKRYYQLITNLLCDAPKIIRYGLLPMLNPKDTWGSVLKDRK